MNPRLLCYSAIRHTYPKLSIFKRSLFRPITTASPLLPEATRADIDVETLRSTSSKVFSCPIFQRTPWVGVCGDFAAGTAQFMSQIELVTIEPCDDYQLSIHTLSLDEMLLRTWARPVYIHHLEEHQQAFGFYTHIELFLSARTLYLRDEAARNEVARFRQLASLEISKGRVYYLKIIRRIEKLWYTAKDIPIHVFLGLQEEVHSAIFSEVDSIVNELLDPPTPGCNRYHIASEEIFNIKSQLTPFKTIMQSSSDIGVEQKKQLALTLWHILTTSQEDGLKSILSRMTEYIPSELDNLQNLSNKAEDISVVPLGPAGTIQ